VIRDAVVQGLHAVCRPERSESRLQGDLEAGCSVQGLQRDPRSWGYGRDCANAERINNYCDRGPSTGKTNSSFSSCLSKHQEREGFFMAALCLSTRGSHVGFKSYMAGTCDQARLVLSSNSRKSPAACPCLSTTLPASS
jgi:hypothetical protein